MWRATALLCLSAVLQVSALPTYFDWYKLCHIPHQGYKGHGSPERNDRITFTLETSNGELKKAWLPGETYTIGTASGSGEDVQAFVHASIGTLSPVASPVSNTKFGFQANGCENAWGSEVSKKSHQMRWEAPAVVPKEGMCVVVSAAQASSQNAAFQTNSVEMCSEGATAWASSYNYGGRQLKWTHAIWLVVSCAGLISGSVMISKSRQRSSSSRANLLESP